MSDTSLDAPAMLGRVLTQKSGSEVRLGQQLMCAAVEDALSTKEHLLVEAGTGTGKTLAYLVPSILQALQADVDDLGVVPRVVVATATKALQEQLTQADLPFLQDSLESQGVGFRYAMLKGRGNYVCRAKLKELTTSCSSQGTITDVLDGASVSQEDLAALDLWAQGEVSGDRADFGRMVPPSVWPQVTVDAGECPGASKCPFGSVCFFEKARAKASESEVVVVNTHLYAAHLATGGNILPDHSAVIFDEAHTLENVFASAFGLRLTPGRLRRLAGRITSCQPRSTYPNLLKGLAVALDLELSNLEGQRVQPTEGSLFDLLCEVRSTIDEAAGALSAVDLSGADEDTVVRFASTVRLCADIGGDASMLVTPSTYEKMVAWVEKDGHLLTLKLATVDVSTVLAAELFPSVTVVATSATLSVAGKFDEVVHRLGLHLSPPGTEYNPEPPPPAWSALQVESPFEYQRQAYLYCPTWMPDARDPDFVPATHEELLALAEAAGGRTLGLFTSRAAMVAAAQYLRMNSDLNVVTQDEKTRSVLLEDFRTTPRSVLLATQGFWVGVDLPGDVLTLVVIDKIPFARPNDPLHQARRESVEARSGNAFAEVDLPQASVLLAQGVGRLVRTTSDRGVVAVMDKRLVTSGYGEKLVRSLPPLRRVKDRNQVLGALRWLDAQANAGPGAPEDLKSQ